MKVKDSPILKCHSWNIATHTWTETYNWQQLEKLAAHNSPDSDRWNLLSQTVFFHQGQSFWRWRHASIRSSCLWRCFAKSSFDVHLWCLGVWHCQSIGIENIPPRLWWRLVKHLPLCRAQALIGYLRFTMMFCVTYTVYNHICITRWWFQIFFIVIPIWGNDPIWLYNIFQMGWNHQLDKYGFANLEAMRLEMLLGCATCRDWLSLLEPQN